MCHEIYIFNNCPLCKQKMSEIFPDILLFQIGYRVVSSTNMWFVNAKKQTTWWSGPNEVRTLVGHLSDVMVSTLSELLGGRDPYSKQLKLSKWSRTGTYLYTPSLEAHLKVFCFSLLPQKYSSHYKINKPESEQRSDNKQMIIRNAYLCE